MEQLSLFDDELNASYSNVARKKTCPEIIMDVRPEIFLADYVPADKVPVFDPRYGELRVTSNPALVFCDAMKKRHDGTIDRVTSIYRDMYSIINYCDNIIWTRNENGDYKGR